MTDRDPSNRPYGFLYIARERKLRGIHGEFGDEILSILEGVGINTYGELLNYAKRKHFSDLPGIDAHAAETIRAFIQGVENGNKAELEDRLHKTQNTLSQESDDNTRRR